MSRGNSNKRVNNKASINWSNIGVWATVASVIIGLFTLYINYLSYRATRDSSETKIIQGDNSVIINYELIYPDFILRTKDLEKEGENPDDELIGLSDYEKSIAIKEDESNLIARSADYIRRNEYKKAEDVLTFLLENDATTEEGRAVAHYNMGIVQIYQDNPNSARDSFEEIPQEKWGYEVYYSMGIVYVMLERYSEAVDEFSRAVDLQNNNVNAYLSRAATYELNKEYFNALSNYQIAMEMDPENITASEGIKRMEEALK